MRFLWLVWVGMVAAGWGPVRAAVPPLPTNALVRLGSVDPLTEFRRSKLGAMEAAITNAIAAGKLPGGVLWLERHGAIYSRAWGERARVPAREPMTEDTVFDAASLTKVLATAPTIMKLVEQGRIKLEAPASQYLPEFGGEGKEAITVRQLLTHTSGLRPGLPRSQPWLGASNALALAAAEPLEDPPGTKFRYSDINFIVLGLLAERVSGQPLDVLAQREVFGPIGMTNTSFRRFEPITVDGLPAERLAESAPGTPTGAASSPNGGGGKPALARIAPTEVLGDHGTLRGVVHDPTARRMGGVAGHAGVFTTAADVARFARVFLNGGEIEGQRIFEPETVAAMTTVQTPPGLPRRGLGWDVDSPYAGERGSVFPIGGFGHTGWTGTSLWVDPFSETILVFLSNRNHPTEDGNILPLRRELGTLAAEAVRNYNFVGVPGALPPEPNRSSNTVTTATAPTPTADVLNGIDVLVRDGFRPLRGLKLGLVTNQTGKDRDRRSTIDLLRAADGVQLVSLFSPEHGIRGALDQAKIGDTQDEPTGLPVYSLYGERRAPTPEQLAALDALVFDVQDVGCRFYTYISTMGNCLEAAANAKKPFIVLDRVNPISGRVEGPLSQGERSFVAWHEIPLRHGLTVGELARLFNAERGFGANLVVIPVEGWQPALWFDQTGLPWINPSPNMRSLTAATLYPGVGLLEYCALSVGRGTGTPFECIGAPYVEDRKLALELNRAGLPGVRFVPVRFTPSASIFAGQECGGVQLIVTDRNAFRAADLGLALATTLYRLYPGELQLEKLQTLLLNPPILEAIKAGKSWNPIAVLWRDELAAFEERRKPFLLYPR